MLGRVISALFKNRGGDSRLISGIGIPATSRELNAYKIPHQKLGTWKPKDYDPKQSYVNFDPKKNHMYFKHFRDQLLLIEGAQSGQNEILYHPSIFASSEINPDWGSIWACTPELIEGARKKLAKFVPKDITIGEFYGLDIDPCLKRKGLNTNQPLFDAIDIYGVIVEFVAQW